MSQLKEEQEKVMILYNYGGSQLKDKLGADELNAWSMDMKTNQIQLKWNKHSADFQQRAKRLQTEKAKLASDSNLAGYAGWAKNGDQDHCILAWINDYNPVTQLCIFC